MASKSTVGWLRQLPVKLMHNSAGSIRCPAAHITGGETRVPGKADSNRDFFPPIKSMEMHAKGTIYYIYCDLRIVSTLQDQTFSLTSSDWYLILNVLSSSLAQNHRFLRTSNTWHGKRVISGFGSTEKSRRDFTTRLLVNVSHDQISIPKWGFLKETC